MGTYTKFAADFKLTENTPNEVLETLLYMYGMSDPPERLPDHKLFSTSRWAKMVYGSDSGLMGSRFGFDREEGCWKVRVRCNLKNYQSEIELFLEWIYPYMATKGFIGYIQSETRAVPLLVYTDKIESGEIYDEPPVIEPGYYTVPPEPIKRVIGLIEKAQKRFTDEEMKAPQEEHEIYAGLEFASQFLNNHDDSREVVAKITELEEMLDDELKTWGTQYSTELASENARVILIKFLRDRGFRNVAQAWENLHNRPKPKDE
jgi:hypothetical protein